MADADRRSGRGRRGTVLTQWVLDPFAVLAIALARGSLYAAGLIRVRRAGPAADRGADRGVLRRARRAGARRCVAGGRLRRRLVHRAHGPAPAPHAARAAAARARRPVDAGAAARVACGPRAVAHARDACRVVAFLARRSSGWLLFVGVPYASTSRRCSTPRSARTPSHALEHALWSTAALIYWWPIVGRDPTPHPMRSPARLLSLFLAMPAMSFLAVAIYLAKAPLYATYANLPAPWGPARARRSAGRGRDDVARRGTSGWWWRCCSSRWRGSGTTRRVSEGSRPARTRS